MAKGEFRFTAGYVQSKKVAELKQTSIKFLANGEQQVGTEEVLGESDGIITCEINYDTIVPVGKMSVDIVTMLLNREDVELGAIFNGKIYKVEGRFTEAEITSQSKSGTTEGKFQFRGGRPKEINF